MMEGLFNATAKDRLVNKVAILHNTQIKRVEFDGTMWGLELQKEEGDQFIFNADEFSMEILGNTFQQNSSSKSIATKKAPSHLVEESKQEAGIDMKVIKQQIMQIQEKMKPAEKKVDVAKVEELEDLLDDLI